MLEPNLDETRLRTSVPHLVSIVNFEMAVQTRDGRILKAQDHSESINECDFDWEKIESAYRKLTARRRQMEKDNPDALCVVVLNATLASRFSIRDKTGYSADNPTFPERLGGVRLGELRAAYARITEKRRALLEKVDEINARLAPDDEDDATDTTSGQSTPATE